MPKASLAGADLGKGNFDINEGNVEITKAVVKVHQYPASKDTGEQSDPFPCVQLEFARLADDLTRTDEEPITMEFSLSSKGLTKIRPGKGESRDDIDPEDLGDEVDTEGNTIYCVEGATVSDKSKAGRLFHSMEECGAKPEIMAGAYMPDFVGVKGHVKTVAGIKIAGQNYKKEPQQLVFDKLYPGFFPGEVKRGKSSAAAKPAASSKPATGTAKSSGGAKTAAAQAAPAPSTASTDPKELANSVVLAVITDYRSGENEGKEPVTRKAFQTAILSKLMRDKVKASLHPPVMSIVKDDDALIELAGEMGFMVDLEAQTITPTPEE